MNRSSAAARRVRAIERPTVRAACAGPAAYDKYVRTETIGDNFESIAARQIVNGFCRSYSGSGAPTTK